MAHWSDELKKTHKSPYCDRCGINAKLFARVVKGKDLWLCTACYDKEAAKEES